MSSKHEGEGPELLSVCGELLYLLCQGEALQQALHDLAALDCHALEEGTVVRTLLFFHKGVDGLQSLCGSHMAGAGRPPRMPSSAKD